MSREVMKCKTCKEETHDFQIGAHICNWCRTLERLRTDEKTIQGIQEYMTSGKALDDLKSFEKWSKRRKVELDFFHDDDPLKEGLGEQVQILFTSKSLLFSNYFVMVGKAEDGWWRRYGWMNIDSHSSKRTYHLKVNSGDLSFEREFRRYRMEEALAQGIVECLRPML